MVTNALPRFTGLQPSLPARSCRPAAAGSYMHGESDDELVALRPGVVDPDAAAHPLDQLAREVETHAKAAPLPEQRRLHLIEGGENAVDVAVRNAAAVVLHLDMDLVDHAMRG